ncbi:MAG: cell division protein FtsX [Magnetovibrionaceae bacterium]
MGILNRRSDLALDKDPLTRFLPWLIAFMVYLACLALAGMLALSQVADRWDKGITGSYTVQIPAAGSIDEDNRRAGLAMKLLGTNPAIASARVMPRSEALDLLEPWLGSRPDNAEETKAGAGSTGDFVDSLPLPVLIDVQLKPDADLDLDRLQRALSDVVADAQLDDHRVWLDRLLDFIATSELLALAILCLIGLAMAATVIFTTRTGLTVHEEAIQVLHLIGAQDVYIASQFARHAMQMALLGSILGLSLALPTLLGLQFLVGRLEVGLMPEVSFGLLEWILIPAPAVLATLLARLTARVTVLRDLARMP